ncbi:MAG TPA: preprotein translocase subunit YajC [Candidatus Methylacidiphilales bacterium]|jgi:preprotein translocase subunit YajC|nr:preprotein translocase subunit YajC [Candidatus Methylacidiphilales bacterium]
MSSSLFAILFAQATNSASTLTGTDTTAPATGASSGTGMIFYFIVFAAMIYFALIRPQSLAKKKAEETQKAAKTGDKIVTSSGIHGVITNVKDSTVIVRVADNVKLEIEKTHIDKITRDEEEKPVTAKVS